MIVTRKKPVEQVLAMLHGVRRVALVGCASCAAACQTGGEKELEQMRQALEKRWMESEAFWTGARWDGEAEHQQVLKEMEETGNRWRDLCLEWWDTENGVDTR